MRNAHNLVEMSMDLIAIILHGLIGEDDAVCCNSAELCVQSLIVSIIRFTANTDRK